MAQHKIASMISRKRKAELAQWLERAIKDADLTQAKASRALAEELNEPIDRSIVNKIIKERREISATELLALQKITGSLAPIDSADKNISIDPISVVKNFREGDIVPDGERVDIARLPPRDLKIVEAALAGLARAEVWRLTSDVLEDLEFHPGDMVIVDLTRKPRAGNEVLAEHNQVPIFRVYTPARLYGMARRKIDTIDIVTRKIIILGVVLRPKLSF